MAQLARKAGAGRLVLVHVDPQSEQADPINLETARAFFPRSELGQDLMEIDF